MRILIVEPKAEGHHMALYVRLIANALSDYVSVIQVLTTASAAKHPSFTLVQNESTQPLELFMMSDVGKSKKSNSFALLNNQLALYKSIHAGFRKIPKDKKPDVVYVVNFDYFEKALALFGSPFGITPFLGMLMNIKFHQYTMGIGPKSRSNWLYKRSFKKILSIPQLKFINVIDECFLEYMDRYPCESYKKVNFIPDVGEVVGQESQEEARSRLGLHSDEFVILLYGSLAKRKGVFELLKAVDNTSKEKLVVLLAGKQDNYTQKLLKEPFAQNMLRHRKLVQFNKFHDKEEEYRVFIASNLVWLGYVEGAYGSSGVLYQSGVMSLPILATNKGLIGWLTQRHNIGLTVDPIKSFEVSSVITSLIEKVSLRNELGCNGYDLSRQHSAEKFTEAIISSIHRAVDINV